MEHHHVSQSVLTGMLYCLAGSLCAGVLSAGLLMLLVMLLN